MCVCVYIAYIEVCTWVVCLVPLYDRYVTHTRSLVSTHLPLDTQHVADVSCVLYFDDIHSTQIDALYIHPWTDIQTHSQYNGTVLHLTDWTGLGTGLGDNNVEWFFILFVRQTTHHSAGIKTRMLYANGIESVFVTKASISWYLALTGRRFKNIK